jgi:hypothetical protein
VERHDQYPHVSSAIAAIVAIACWQRRPLNCFAEFIFGTLPGVFEGNELGDEGVKALGDALKENTTVTSLSLNLRGE